MELDMLGQHNDGPVVLELKVEKSAERNAFSELLAYSNYLSEMFALAGSKDITNVLIAKVEAKITRSAFLYDLLIADRNTIVYKPVTGEQPSSLRLQLHLPSDDDFRYFTNQLLAHDSVACVVASFHDLPGWFDGEKEDGNLNDYTQEHLSAISGYTAQLMEAERLNGFCFIRKRWKELELHYENSLIVCAINPFRLADVDRAAEIYSQLSEDRDSFFETVKLSFAGRIIDVARRAIEDCLTHDPDLEIDTPIWSAMVSTGIEVVFTHNFGFRPTGVFREAYTGYLNSLYAANAAAGEVIEDVSTLKINEVNNWLRAWTFMEMCGFKKGESAEDCEDDEA
jgi:hypothetical protein